MSSLWNSPEYLQSNNDRRFFNLLILSGNLKRVIFVFLKSVLSLVFTLILSFANGFFYFDIGRVIQPSN